MFSTVEKYSGPAKIMLALIALTFVGFGVGTVSPGSDYIVKIGSRKISTYDVQRAAHNSGGSSEGALNALIQRAYMLEGAGQIGIGVSLDLLKQSIVDDPAFHDGQGRFSEEKFKQYLQQAGMSADDFIGQIREQYELQNLLNLSQNGALVSDAQISQAVSLLQAERTIRTLTLDPRAFAGQVRPTDGALKAFYEKNKQDYILPQAVKFQYIALSAKSLAASQSVSEEELKKAFEEQQKAAVPRREVAHIMFSLAGKDKAQVKALAEKVLAEAKAQPDRFAELAKQHSADTASAANGGGIGRISKNGSLPAPFEQAAFAQAKGEIGGIVETPDALHIIKVLDIPPQQTFEEARAGLEAGLKEKKAKQELSRARETLSQTTFDAHDSLEPAAKKLGLAIQGGNEWASRQDLAAAKLPAELADALFGDEVFKKKHNSEPITVGDETWVVRATAVREQTQQTFEQAKDKVRAAYTETEAAKLALAQAKKELADLQKNAKPATGPDWSPVETLNTENARMRMPPQAFNAMLRARPSGGKPAYVLLEGLPAPVVMEIQAVKVPKAGTAETENLRGLLAQRNSEEMLGSLLAYLQQTVDAKQGAQRMGHDNE
ncbi:MAG: SurA N-terminal domain-containing protein [Neisseria sp.]|nr:SurA N-terminal domain-containing protein [Neisseria sp.]